MPEMIESYREQIDQVDKEILLLLSKRFEAAARIGEIKRVLGARVLDAARESQVLEDRAQYAEANGVDPNFSNQLFSLVMAHSRALQSELPEKSA